MISMLSRITQFKVHRFSCRALKREKIGQKNVDWFNSICMTAQNGALHPSRIATGKNWGTHLLHQSSLKTGLVLQRMQKRWNLLQWDDWFCDPTRFAMSNSEDTTALGAILINHNVLIMTDNMTQYRVSYFVPDRSTFRVSYQTSQSILHWPTYTC